VQEANESETGAVQKGVTERGDEHNEDDDEGEDREDADDDEDEKRKEDGVFSLASTLVELAQPSAQAAQAEADPQDAGWYVMEDGREYYIPGDGFLYRPLPGDYSRGVSFRLKMPARGMGASVQGEDDEEGGEGAGEAVGEAGGDEEEEAEERRGTDEDEGEGEGGSAGAGEIVAVRAEGAAPDAATHNEDGDAGEDRT